jgi:glycosyltransferase involved in cell wall biosynthesis
MNQPLISIVIATYNRYSSLESYSFPSLKNLKYPNFEVIVINDCSTDETANFLSDCQKNMNNLMVFHNDKNRGLCYSRNHGVAHAKGEIVVFTDDDVSLFPDCLDELVKIYEQDADVMAIWGCVYQYGGSWIKGTKTFGTGSLMSFRKVVFNRFRFDTNLRYFGSYVCDEHDFMRQIQRDGCKIIKVDTVQADHFHAPAENRAWRGLGGDLNYVYEKLKSGSIFNYYACLLLGSLLLLKRLLTGHVDESLSQHYFHEVLETPKRLIVFIKQRQISIAAKWLFYILIDIPLRAKTKVISDYFARTYTTTWPI